MIVNDSVSGFAQMMWASLGQLGSRGLAHGLAVDLIGITDCYGAEFYRRACI